MSTTLTRKAMDTVVPLSYDSSVNRLKKIMLAKGMSSEKFDHLMQIKVPSREALREMQAEGKLPSNEELAHHINK